MRTYRQRITASLCLMLAVSAGAAYAVLLRRGEELADALVEGALELSIE